MIENIQINSVHADVDDDLRKYVTKKIGHLDRYMPKKARQSAKAEVHLKDTRRKDKNQHSCEVVLYLPHDVLTTSETTMNFYAAVDIVEAKLHNQIKKYKDKHNPVRLHKRFVARLRRGGRS